MLQATEAQDLQFPKYMILLQTSCRIPWSEKGYVVWPTQNNTKTEVHPFWLKYQIHIPDKPLLIMCQNFEAKMNIGAAVLPITCVCVCD